MANSTVLPLSSPASSNRNHADKSTKIDGYPQGYPRLAALVSSHPSFFAFRRFSALRARMLLYKQDRISVLEERLDSIDLQEPRPLFHGSNRRDENQDRQNVIAELDTALANYDELLGRTERVLSYRSAQGRSISTLREWVEEFGCISREESEYLLKADLMSIVPSEFDDFFERMDGPVEDLLIWLSARLGKDLRSDVSKDPNLYIFPERLIRIISRIFAALAPSALLIIPMIISTLVEDRSWRLFIVLLSTAVFVMTVSLMARIRLENVFAAGAAYAAVLVVYISGNSD